MSRVDQWLGHCASEIAALFAARVTRSPAAMPLRIDTLESRRMFAFPNWSSIGPAIAKVPEATGQIANTSVVNFGTTVYTGPLNVKNTLDRIRADGATVDSDDGSVYTNPQADGLPVDGTYYEFVVKPTNGTDRSFTFASPGPMRVLLSTGGDVFFTGDHYDTFNTVYLHGTATPTIGSFSDSPTSVVTGTATTLTASSVTESGGTISNVKFYRESNGTSGLQTSADTLVGTDTTATSNAYSVSASTTGLAAGTYTYYAVATDANGTASATASTTLTVTASGGGGGGGTSGVALAWNVASQTAYGTQGLAASTVASGVTTSGTAASAAWGGANWASTSSAGISGNETASFGLTVGTGKTVSLSSVDLFYRRSSSGPASGLWQYQIGTGSWTTIADVSNEFSSTSSSGAAMTELSLAGVSALQNLAAGTKANLRVVPYGSSSSGGTWYVYDTTGNDLVLNGTIGTSPAAKSVAANATAKPASLFSAMAIAPMSSLLLGPSGDVLDNLS